MTKRSFWSAMLAVGVLATVTHAGQPTPVALVLMEGDVLGGSTVSSLNTPFTDGNGKVGFVGALADSQRFIWWNTGPVFYSNQALPLALTGGESTMGVSNTGGFIYSPSVDGNDAVYTHGGSLLKKTDYIASLGLYSAFNSRPTMIPDGTAYWIGGTATSPTGSTSNRHLLKATDPTDPSTITAVLSGGDVIEGKVVKTSASHFNYWISDNGQHHIHLLDMDTGTLNEHVYLNGTFVAVEGDPTGQGDNWATFNSVGVNDAGHYIVAGGTNGATATDRFLAYNGAIGVREGDTLDGVTLASGATTRAVAINNLDQVAHIWGWGTGSSLSEHLFLGNGADLAHSARLLSTGDQVDVNGDGLADFVLSDMSASASIGPGLDLGGDGWVYLEVVLTRIGGTETFNAIIGVPEPASLGLLALGLLVLRRR